MTSVMALIIYLIIIILSFAWYCHYCIANFAAIENSAFKQNVFFLSFFLSFLFYPHHAKYAKKRILTLNNKKSASEKIQR